MSVSMVDLLSMIELLTVDVELLTETTRQIIIRQRAIEEQLARLTPKPSPPATTEDVLTQSPVHGRF